MEINLSLIMYPDVPTDSGWTNGRTEGILSNNGMHNIIYQILFCPALVEALL